MVKTERNAHNANDRVIFPQNSRKWSLENELIARIVNLKLKTPLTCTFCGVCTNKPEKKINRSCKAVTFCALFQCHLHVVAKEMNTARRNFSQNLPATYVQKYFSETLSRQTLSSDTGA